jgi:hypothetical protein
MRRKEYGPAALRIRLPHLTLGYREVNLKGGKALPQSGQGAVG